MTWTHERKKNVVNEIIIFILLGTVTSEHTSKDVLNILLWTSSSKKPFDMLEIGFTPFTNRVCAYQNCFFTKKDNSTLSNVTKYDAIIFNVVNLQSDTREAIFPKFRNPEQSYILFSIEPPSLYPLHKDFQGAFNLTWTYKLDSNITFPYLSVYNNLGTRIAPKMYVDWIKYNDMKHTKKYLKRKLERKIIAAAWIVSNCLAKNRRLEFVHDLQQELTKYNLSIDIFGRCGNMECKTYDLDECYAAIETDYYFYLAFENSCHEDYVTEKVLHGLRHYTVPIVYGGANYSRYVCFHIQRTGLRALKAYTYDLNSNLCLLYKS